MTTNFNERMIKIILPNILGYERIAMASSASLAKMFGFSSGRIEDLKTIVAEAATNAMQHGNKGCADSEITITIRFKDNAIHVAVIDQGDGFEETLPKPDIDQILSNPDSAVGFGVFLIQELADEVEFNTITESGHCVNIVVRKDPK